MTQIEPADSTEKAVVIELLRDFLASTARENVSSEIETSARVSEDLGLDILSRAELLARLEDRLSVALEGEEFLTASTVGDLVQIVANAVRKGSPESRPAFMPDRTSAPATRKSAGEFKTLNEVLTSHAAASPARTHIYLVDDREGVTQITYEGLFRGAQSTAAALLSQGLRPGECVALILPTGQDLLKSFFGILLAGGVPVPLYPPLGYDKLEEHLRRQAGILNASRAPFLLSMKELMPLKTVTKALAPRLKDVMLASELTNFRHDGSGLYKAKEGDPAFIQFTSGSTGNPKGVVLTHANLLANIRSMGQAIQISPEDRFVSWLPLYHDMGLIGAWLGSMTFDIELVLMSPLTFLSRPIRWLRAICEFKGTLSAAPNFAYQLCAERIASDDLQKLDLSSWRLAFNGAEPVSAKTLERFAHRFAPAGFNPNAITPVYGLAENSVGLCFPPPGRGPLVKNVKRSSLQLNTVLRETTADDPDMQQIVSSGRPIPNNFVRIVNRYSEELPDGSVGRLQFKGPCATRGYLNNPEATQQLFDGDWLNSGDFAVRFEGEIFVTGREKDLIIFGGRNIYPQDIEDEVGKLEGVRRGCVAVFASPNPRTGTERMVVAAEVKDPSRAEALKGLIIERVYSVVNLPPDEVVLVPPKSVPKTSSGKIRRSECRARYESGELGKKQTASIQLFKLLVKTLPALARRALQRARDVAYGCYFIAVYLILSLLSVAALAFVSDLRKRRSMLRRVAREMIRLWFLPYHVEGQENLNGLSRAVAVSNHSSYLDAIVLTSALPPLFSYVAKKEFARHWLMRRLLKLNGTRYVERFDIREGLDDTQELVEAAHNGESLTFFPEGTFRLPRGLMPFKTGAFVIAARSDTPVIPITVNGTRDILPAYTWLPRRHDLSIFIGKPIEPAKIEAASIFEKALKLRDAARAAILEKLDEPDLA